MASEMPYHAKHHASVLAARTRSLVIAMSHNMSLGEGRSRYQPILHYHNRPSPRLEPSHVFVTKLRSIALRFSLAWCFARCGISDALGFKFLYG